jgi:hypothetical protein
VKDLPQYLSNNVVSLRLQAVEMRLRRSPLSVCVVFFADEVGKKTPHRQMFLGTMYVPTPLAGSKA